MNIILAPHPDDELIGCWSLLNAREVDIVVYFFDCGGTRRSELEACACAYGFKPIFSSDYCGEQLVEMFKEHNVYLPAFTDSHPEHKYVNRRFRKLPNKKFYSVDLDRASGKTLLSEEERVAKLDALNTLYPSQKSLWENNFSYVLFESLSDADYSQLYENTCQALGRQFVIRTDIPIFLRTFDPESHSLESMGPALIDHAITLGCSSVEVQSSNKVWKL